MSFEIIANFEHQTHYSMKKLALLLIAIAAIACQKKEYPDLIRIEGGKLHVQGIALDQKNDCMYCSFTSAFYKTDLEGNITGSVTGINGHLGAMTFDPVGRKVYASLEFKDDAIGKGIARTLGAEEHKKEDSRFYVAEINVDKIKGFDMPFEDVVKLHPINEAGKDYLDYVEMDGVKVDHKYGCSGIDGITIGPAFGSGSKKNDHLYVAYGVYGDTTRVDNDYNIILCYSLKDLSKPLHKYFVFTGNTRYGVQNMAYDSYSKKLFLAVYKGSKSQYPNYDLFALDINQKPYMATLQNVPYQTEEVEQLDVCGNWHFKWGSTGLCSLGDGRWFISEKTKENGVQVCNARQYSLDGETPFVPYSK